jgi:uncharacterized protein (DUF2252 family)
VPQPKWKSEAERVVAVQQRMQAVPMAFLHAVRFDGKPFALRALQPAEDRLALVGSRLAAEPLTQLVATLARVVAWAQLRSAGREGSASADEWIAFGQRKKWQGLLLDASLDCAAQVTKDAVAYNAAWDGGAFRV